MANENNNEALPNAPAPLPEWFVYLHTKYTETGLSHFARTLESMLFPQSAEKRRANATSGPIWIRLNHREFLDVLLEVENFFVDLHRYCTQPLNCWLIVDDVSDMHAMSDNIKAELLEVPLVVHEFGYISMVARMYEDIQTAILTPKGLYLCEFIRAADIWILSDYATQRRLVDEHIAAHPDQVPRFVCYITRPVDLLPIATELAIPCGRYRTRKGGLLRWLKRNSLYERKIWLHVKSFL